MQTQWFGKYLQTARHSAGAKLLKQSPKFLKMKCQTNHNDQDCAIFVMRHMESFNGGPITKYDCGLKREGQFDQIEMLRKKYATKILLCNLNLNKDIVLPEAGVFAKLPRDVRQGILDEAFARKDQRLALI